MQKALISLGSNLGESLLTIENALNEIAKLEGVRLLARSALYQTKPWGFSEQNDFINALCEIETSLSPLKLLEALQGLEQKFFRVRSENHYGPRTLDLDIIDFQELILDDPKLTLPHPRAKLRAFVLKPLVDLKGDYTFANGDKALSLLQALPSSEFEGIKKL